MSTSAVERGIKTPSGGDIFQAERVQAEVISGITPSLRAHRIGWELRIATPLAGVLGLLSIACTSPARSENIQVRPTATAVSIGAEFVPTGNEEIDNIQKRLMDPTTKAQVSEEDILKLNEAITKKGEAEQVIQCKILPDEFCNLGEPITRPGRGGQITSIRYIVPDTPISSLFAADVTVVLKNTEGVPQIVLTPKEDKTIPPLSVKGDLVEIIRDDIGKGVVEGAQVAKTGKTGIIFATWSGLNTATGKTVTPTEMLALFERFFGKQVMQKSPVEVPLASAGGGWNIAEPKFLP